MRYFRAYPWAFQLVLFLLMMFTFLSGSQAIVLSVLTKMTGYTLVQLAAIGPGSPATMVNVAIWVQGILNLTIFFLPGYLFAYLSTPRPLEFLGLRRPGKNVQSLLVVLIMIGATPVFQMIEGLIGKIDFGAAVKAQQEANDNMMTAFLNISSFGSFIKVFVIMAIVPALGEEIFFRGVMMRFVRQRSRSMVLPVIFTATLFSLSHTNIYGYLSIFLAGVLLAVIYNLTGSLWCSILAHMSFNGLQVILMYASARNADVKTFMEQSSVPYLLVVAGAALFGVSFYLLLKNSTPLPANWSDNFTPEERIKDNWDLMSKKEEE